MSETELTKEQVVERLCDLLAKVWDRFEPKAEHANDCFCSKNGHRNPRDFRFAQQSLIWVENLVRSALRDTHSAPASEQEAVPTARDVALALLDAVEAYVQENCSDVAINTVEQCIKDIASLSSGGPKEGA